MCTISSQLEVKSEGKESFKQKVVKFLGLHKKDVDKMDYSTDVFKEKEFLVIFECFSPLLQETIVEPNFVPRHFHGTSTDSFKKQMLTFLGLSSDDMMKIDFSIDVLTKDEFRFLRQHFSLPFKASCDIVSKGIKKQIMVLLGLSTEKVVNYAIDVLTNDEFIMMQRLSTSKRYNDFVKTE